MKLARDREGVWEWRLTRSEWLVVAAVGGMYPWIPPDYHQTTRAGSRSSVSPDAALLRDALAAGKAELEARLRGWLKRQSLRSSRREVVLRLTGSDLELWLQVMNDIRVGCWVRLGCPEQDAIAGLEPTPANGRHLFLMEFCGMVQARFLEALDGLEGSATD